MRYIKFSDIYLQFTYIPNLW